MKECPECHYPCEGACDNPACPQDKTGLQLERILTAEALWMAREEYLDACRRSFARRYAGTTRHEIF